jgi:hypothetical protein
MSTNRPVHFQSGYKHWILPADGDQELDLLLQYLMAIAPTK